MLLVFRAIQGIGKSFAILCFGVLRFSYLVLSGAAMTLPSAISMIVQNFPEPAEQSRALSVFAAFGAFGQIFGFVLVSAFVTLPFAFY